MRPAKTQISLSICLVWSESLLSAWGKLGSFATHWVLSENSDQTGWMPRLIWVFPGLTGILLVLSWGGSNVEFILNKDKYLNQRFKFKNYLDRVKQIWYLSPMKAVKVQVSLRIHAVSPEPSLLAHTSSESWGTFRQKARSLAPLNVWACAVKICHDRMLEDTNSLDATHLMKFL